MVDMQEEKFSAKAAMDAGLAEAVKRGEVKISGKYELTADGYLNYTQKPFVFKDKHGALRCGKFVDTFHDIAELTKFSALVIESKIAP